MTDNCTTMTGLLRISLREARLVLDRALLQTGMPYGFNAAVRECILVSEAMTAEGLGGFAKFMRLHDTLKAARPDTLQPGAAKQTQPQQVDCAGQHAWVVAQMLLDLLLAESSARGVTVLHAIELADPAELKVVAMLAQRQGASVTVEMGQACSGSGSATLTLMSRTLPPKDFSDPVLRDIVRHGLPVDAALWWSMYHLSLGALTPDNVVSRRHAGANIVDDNGRVIGRPTDDDTDFSLLTRVARPAHAP